jgi:hypothetical protein
MQMSCCKANHITDRPATLYRVRNEFIFICISLNVYYTGKIFQTKVTDANNIYLYNVMWTKLLVFYIMKSFWEIW